jgi:hypothetical protein
MAQALRNTPDKTAWAEPHLKGDPFLSRTVDQLFRLFVEVARTRQPEVVAMITGEGSPSPRRTRAGACAAASSGTAGWTPCPAPSPM